MFLPCRKAAAWPEGVSGDLTLVTADCAKTLCFCKTNSHLGRDPGQTLHTRPEEAKPRPFHSACATAASRRLIPWLNLTGENKSQVFGQKESASPHMKNNQGGSGCLLPSIHTSVATARQPTALRPPVNATRALGELGPTASRVNGLQNPTTVPHPRLFTKKKSLIRLPSKRKSAQLSCTTTQPYCYSSCAPALLLQRHSQETTQPWPRRTGSISAAATQAPGPGSARGMRSCSSRGTRSTQTRVQEAETKPLAAHVPAAASLCASNTCISWQKETGREKTTNPTPWCNISHDGRVLSSSRALSHCLAV